MPLQDAGMDARAAITTAIGGEHAGLRHQLRVFQLAGQLPRRVIVIGAERVAHHDDDIIADARRVDAGERRFAIDEQAAPRHIGGVFVLAVELIHRAREFSHRFSPVSLRSGWRLWATLLRKWEARRVEYFPARQAGRTG